MYKYQILTNFPTLNPMPVTVGFRLRGDHIHPLDIRRRVMVQRRQLLWTITRAMISHTNFYVSLGDQYTLISVILESGETLPDKLTWCLELSVPRKLAELDSIELVFPDPDHSTRYGGVKVVRPEQEPRPKDEIGHSNYCWARLLEL